MGCCLNNYTKKNTEMSKFQSSVQTSWETSAWKFALILSLDIKLMNSF